MKKTFTKGIAVILAAIMLSVALPLSNFGRPVLAASIPTKAEMNSSEMFFKKNEDVTRNLATVAMLYRRTSRLMGQSNWRSITESSIYNAAWINGTGLAGEINYNGIHCICWEVSNFSEEWLASLMSHHPEGLMLYNRNVSGAVLITDLDVNTGIFGRSKNF